MSKIIDLPTLDRPREKALRYGISSLSDAELLAIIIRSGYPGVSALEVANDLLGKYHGLLGLYHTDFNVYKRIKGVKDNRGLSIAACFELYQRLNKKESDENGEKIDSEYLYNRYKTELLAKDQEQLILVIVNRLQRIIYECTLYQGTKDNMLFSYTDVWKELTVHKAFGFYLIHNHPQLPSISSKMDKIMTQEVLIEAKRKKYHFLDHIVIGIDGYYSFKKEKIFNFSY